MPEPISRSVQGKLTAFGEPLQHGQTCYLLVDGFWVAGTIDLSHGERFRSNKLGFFALQIGATISLEYVPTRRI